MNKKWQKRRSLPSGDGTQVIRCTGPEVPLVLAKLRRSGMTHTEPALEPDNRTAEVLPSGLVSISGKRRERQYVISFCASNRPPALAGEDRVFSFRDFDQGARGQVGLS